MDHRKFVYRETALVAIGQAACVAVMVGAAALLGHCDRAVLLGGIFGGLLAIINFFFMAVGIALAGDKAVRENVKGGEATVRASYFLRMTVLAVLLFALTKSGLCNGITAVLPLTFTRPILTLGEFFRKPGARKA